ncbi:hypothetical protein [Longirhabdus pacifica]|uniref:hypothetical protein n=1 Tax=Longirhabdus pacifica TaxID=2305227 RepID=UPI001008E0A7|nr:hypothetical protein [Longirhabdus pacifica]
MDNKERMKKLCEKYMHRYVMVQTTNGGTYDGIVENIDDENVYLAVPNCDENATRSFSGNYHVNQFYRYPYGFGYGYPGFFYPRFRRFFFPLAALTGLALLPYYW